MKETIHSQLKARFKLNSSKFLASIPVHAYALDPQLKSLSFLPTEQKKIIFKEIENRLPLSATTASVQPASKKRKINTLSCLMGNASVSTSVKTSEFEQYQGFPGIDEDEDPLLW